MIKEKLDSFHLEDVKNQVHPSVFFKHEDYDLFILRLPQVIDEKIVQISNAFVVTDDSYYYFDKENDNFIDLKSIKGFYRFLDKKIDLVLKITLNQFNEIEEIEDRFYDGKSIKDFNQQWFAYKTDIVRINRVLFKAVQTMNDLILNYKHEEEYLERNFEDIEEHLQRAYRNSGLLLEKLDALYNFNLTQTNEQMNQTVYILTLLSGIFLPLNLIVGFFGMNTTSLPFTVANGGTYKVILLLISIGVLASVITYMFKRK
jgi:magnesium transporter